MKASKMMIAFVIFTAFIIVWMCFFKEIALLLDSKKDREIFINFNFILIGSVSNGYERGRTPRRPYSTSYDFQNYSSGLQSGLRSVRSSPMRDMGAPLTASRRSSIVDSRRLPWPEPSPIRELPPQAPKIKVKHYPLPPPSYTEGMIAVSKRLRNRSSSPAPNYAELELSKRPALIPAAIGRPSPSREMIRMSMSGPPLKYNYGRYI